MKKFGLLILGLFITLFIGNTTQANDYEYTNLDITANIQEDGTIHVLENYTANFFVKKHGIIRDIPFNYNVDGNDFHIDVNNINVKGKHFTTTNNGDEVSIKIGEANKELIGEQEYPISYDVYGLIRNFSGKGYAELYWNLVGYGFDTNINKVKAIITLPKTYTGFTKNDFLITTDGKTKTVEGFEGTLDWSQGDRIIIEYDKILPAYQGITLAIKLPYDMFEFDHKKQGNLIGSVGASTNIFNIRISQEILEMIMIMLSPFSTFLLGILIYLTYRFFKGFQKIDLSSGKLYGKYAKEFPVIVQYDPPKGLTSAEVGLLLHHEARTKDLLSLIYQWANQGLISISKKDSKTIILKKLKNIGHKRPKYEKIFFQKFFDEEIDDDEVEITRNTYIYSKGAIRELNTYGQDEMQRYEIVYDEKLVYLLLGILSIFLSLFPVFIIAVITDTIKRYSVKVSEEGAKNISHILGYRKFLVACEEKQLRTLLKEDPLYFDKVLPYAIVFGIDTILTKKFKPIMEELKIKSKILDGDMESSLDMISIIKNSAYLPLQNFSYDSDSGFSSGSSFSSDSSFSSGGGGGGGGGRSW